MQSFLATFEDGVLKPSQPLNLPANSAVRVTVELVGDSPLTVDKLNDFLKGLPSLGDDRSAFESDIKTIRAEIPSEANPWD